MDYRPIISQPAAARTFNPRRNVGMLGALLGSNRFVLGGALILSVLLPLLVMHWDDGGFRAVLSASDARSITWLIISGAIVAGHSSLQCMGTLPLISARSLILPNFLAAFCVASLVIYALALPANKFEVVLSFSIALGWYFAVSGLRIRHLRPTIGLLSMPVPDACMLPGNIDWRRIDRLQFPHDLTALVVDPHAQLDVESSHLITELVLEGIPVYHRAHFEEGATGRVRFSSQADNNFGALLPSLTYLRLKRVVDVAGAIVLLPFVMLLILVAAILIRFDSPGPVLYRQVRMGFRGQPFTCYKLRTMRTDREGPSFTLEGDPRVTRVGRTLRKWRIDELPQIINIFKGEMSWIGPRPEAIELATRYAAHVPFYHYRHAVRPGISGWAAVHQGNVGEVDAAREKLEYDFYYIKYFSVWLDFLIVLKTIHTVSNGFGSR